ncbi:hypothetical protein [Dactylosporangium sp. CA-233914]|uniref:hypothetical protein n=1 Tax=Dactylosporangium sp. CA-233914 TaxID=3239934 RepID=UPI003D90DD50
MRTPPSLLRALDYPGDAQFVALYQDGRVGRATDGVDAVDAEPYGWQLFRDHAMTQRLIAPYDIGDRGGGAQHWLVVDRGSGKIAVMRPDDAAQLLNAQPRTRDAQLDGLNPEERAIYLDAVQRRAIARPDTDAGWFGAWMEYARPLAGAQRELVRDLNGQAGRSLLHRIHGLNASVHQTVSDLTDPERSEPADRPSRPLQPDRDASPPSAARAPDDLSADKPPDAAHGDLSLD